MSTLYYPDKIIMFNKAIAFALIGISTFTAVNMTSVEVGPQGNLTLTAGEQKAEARRMPRPKPQARPKPKPTVQPKPSGPGKAVGRVLKGMEGVSNLIDGYEFFTSFNGGDIFIVPNEFPNEWNDVAQMCDRRNGNLIWRNDLKTCIPR